MLECSIEKMKINVTLRPNTNILADPRNAWVVVKIVGDLEVPGAGDKSHGSVARPGECISTIEAEKLVICKTRFEVTCVE